MARCIPALTAMAALCAMAAAAGDRDTKVRRVVYGSDTRQEEAAQSAFWKGIGSKTVMLVQKSALAPNSDGTYRVVTTTVHGSSPGGLTQGGGCPPVPFATQVVPGFCSGTLIADDLIATAGHCVTTQAACDNTFVVFNATNVAIAAAQGVTANGLPANTVFECGNQFAGTLADAWSSRANSYNLGYGGRSVDWKVLQLKTTVATAVATAAAVKTSGFTSLNQGLVMIGYPSGLPRKYADNSTVAKVWTQSPDGSYRFVANLDSFAGNSGSGVFDSTTGELVGILVSGATDFVQSGGCVSVNECPFSNVASCQNFMAANGGSASTACQNSNGDSCIGETVTGANVLSSALVQKYGCNASLPCLNGGTCNSSSLCECPVGTVGSNCIQTIGTAFCNGNLGTGFLTCPLISNGVTLQGAVGDAPGLRCNASMSGDTSTNNTHFTGSNSPESFVGFNLTTETDVTIDTCGSSFDTLIRLWNLSTIQGFYNTHQSLSEIATNDDIPTSGFSCTGQASGMSGRLAPGAYVVQIEGFQNAAGAYVVNFNCSCGGGTCDAAFDAVDVDRNLSLSSVYTFNSDTKACDDLTPPVDDLDQCFSSCQTVAVATFGTSRTVTAASYGQSDFFKYEECRCTTRPSSGGAEQEDTLCKKGPDTTALIICIVIGCLCCCGCCFGIAYLVMKSQKQKKQVGSETRASGSALSDAPPAYSGSGYPTQGLPNQAYPSQGYPSQGYPQQTQPQGYPPQAYPPQAYPPQAPNEITPPQSRRETAI